jgi:hypothetical protein
VSDFEDLVRRTMRARDDEAPTVDQFRERDVLVAPRRNVRWPAVAAAAACVLALVGVLVAVNRGGRHHDAAGPTTTFGASAVLTCPKSYPPSGVGTSDAVPEQAKGVDGRSRLVPQELPAHVVVCGYLEENTTALTQQRQLTGDLSIIPATFSWLPGSDMASAYCAGYLGPYVPGNYLFGISYPDGTVWISAPRQTCDGASNGQFMAADNLSQYARDALSTGTWQLAGPKTVDGCPAPTTSGRLGQETALVPDIPISVQVCAFPRRDSSPPVVGRVMTGAVVHTLVDALGSLPTKRWIPLNCPVTPGSNSQTYVATFSYSLGPPLQLTIAPACGDAVYNGSLQASDGGAMILEQVQALLPR